jgi:hypothetical protein
MLVYDVQNLWDKTYSWFMKVFLTYRGYNLKILIVGLLKNLTYKVVELRFLTCFIYRG